jgi:hypothetical protein
MRYDVVAVALLEIIVRAQVSSSMVAVSMAFGIKVLTEYDNAFVSSSPLRGCASLAVL